jgi:hypothetical protein
MDNAPRLQRIFPINACDFFSSEISPLAHFDYQLKCPLVNVYIANWNIIIIFMR